MLIKVFCELQMTPFVLITILSVSIDSFVCGFSLSFKKGKIFLIPIIIAFTVFVMCLFANYLTYTLDGFLTETTANLSGIILIVIGIINLVKKGGNTIPNDVDIIKQSFITGIAVGFDGAFANLSLALMGYNEFWVPLTIALTHAVAIYLGLLLSKTNLAQKFGKLEFFPPLILIILGAYKLLGFFI